MCRVSAHYNTEIASDMFKSDVLVSAVQYDRDRQRVEFVRLRVLLNGAIGHDIADVRRDKLIDMIKNEGMTAMTVYHEEGAWIAGSTVHVTSQGFLRTFGDLVEHDDLGDLPEIDVAKPFL